MTALINAAKKHQTDVRYWVKKIMVTRQDTDINTPNKWVLLILEIKSGVMEVNRYNPNAINDSTFGLLSTLYRI